MPDAYRDCAGALHALCDILVQVDTAIERSRDGLGIGLTLVKRLVRGRVRPRETG
jgi:hypothetical protein